MPQFRHDCLLPRTASRNMLSGKADQGGGIMRVRAAASGQKLRLLVADDAQATFAADYAVDHGLAEWGAIVHDGTAFGEGIAGEFRRRLAERERIVSRDGCGATER